MSIPPTAAETLLSLLDHSLTDKKESNLITDHHIRWLRLAICRSGQRMSHFEDSPSIIIMLVRNLIIESTTIRARNWIFNTKDGIDKPLGIGVTLLIFPPIIIFWIGIYRSDKRRIRRTREILLHQIEIIENLLESSDSIIGAKDPSSGIRSPRGWVVDGGPSAFSWSSAISN